MNERKAIVPAGMEAVYEKIRYAPAVKVGNTIYVSGQIGRDAAMQLVEGREAQIVQAFENLKLVLTAAGASMSDVVEITSFHTDMRDLPAIHAGARPISHHASATGLDGGRRAYAGRHSRLYR